MSYTIVIASTGVSMLLKYHNIDAARHKSNWQNQLQMSYYFRTETLIVTELGD